MWGMKKWNLWDAADMCWTAVHWKHRHHKFLRWHLDSWTYTGVFNVANQCILFTVVYFVANALYHAKHLKCAVNSRHLELILESAETHATLFMRPHLLNTHTVQLCAFFPIRNSEKQQRTVDFTLLQKLSAWNATKISPAWLLPAPEGLLFCFLPLPCNRKLLLTILARPENMHPSWTRTQGLYRIPGSR